MNEHRNYFKIVSVFIQQETAEHQDDVIKNVEGLRQKLLKITQDTAQKINTLQSEAAELEVGSNFFCQLRKILKNISANFYASKSGDLPKRNNCGTHQRLHHRK